MANKTPNAFEAQPPKFEPLSNLGQKGLMTVLQPSQISPEYSPAMRDVEITEGTVAVRGGSSQRGVATSGALIKQIMVASDSAGNEFVLGTDYSHIYLQDNFAGSINGWVNLTPSLAYNGVPFSYVGWNKGIGYQDVSGADILYMGDGISNLSKWIMGVAYLSTATATTDTSLVCGIDNGNPSDFPNGLTNFPPVGIEVMVDAGNDTTTWAASQNASNIIINPNYSSVIGGTVSLEFTITVASPDQATLTKTFSSPVNWASYEAYGTLTYDVYMAAITNFTSYTTTLKTDQNNYWYQTVTTQKGGGAFVVGWNTIEFVWSSATKTGSPIANSIAALQIDLAYASSFVPSSPWLFDNIQISVSQQPILIGGTVHYYNAINYSTNTLTLTAAIGVAYPIETMVTFPIQQLTGIQSGSSLAKSAQRLYMAGVQGTDTTIYGSALGDPENFNAGEDINSGLIEEVADGEGAITGLVGTDTEVLLFKKDRGWKFSFQITSTSDSSGNVYYYKLPTFAPLVMTKGGGSLNQQSIVSANMEVFYVSPTNGITILQPRYYYTEIIYEPKVLSVNIQNTIVSSYPRVFPNEYFSFSGSSGVYWNNRVFWTCSYGGTDELSGTNILCYDVLYQRWTAYDVPYAPISLATYKGQLICAGGTTAIHNILEGGVYDDGGSAIIPSYYTPRLNWGNAALVSTVQEIYIQGYAYGGISFYVDVVYNEGDGTISTDTYTITPSGSTISFFRKWLRTSTKKFASSIQLKIYSTAVDAYWAIETIELNPVITPNVNPDNIITL